MKHKPKIHKPKIVLVNTTMLAPLDNNKCSNCGKYGCTDRGYTITINDENPITLAEADMGRQMIEKLVKHVHESDKREAFRIINYEETSCVRKLKKSNAETIINRLKNCSKECQRNNISLEGGLYEPRNNHYNCPFRNENKVCQQYTELDNSPLPCLGDYHTQDCDFYETAYQSCKYRVLEQCSNVNVKHDISDENDYLFMLSHRFSVAPCRFSNEKICANPDSEHNEGVCSLQALMTPCTNYQPMPSDKAYTEGVFTTVSSIDGKDDLKIFPSSDYARRLNKKQRLTLCVACRISHSIAKATGLKCLGVRRSTQNVLLNEDNPLHDSAIQINYLYLTNTNDLAKYNTELIAQAVFNGLTQNCIGIGCEEYQSCNFNSL